MADKSLGQVAYEGWDSDVMTHKPWDEIEPGFQAAWQAAAEAVIVAAVGGARIDRRQSTASYEAEKAVIEAAKALYKAEAYDEEHGDPLTSAEAELARAIEALEAEEK